MIDHGEADDKILTVVANDGFWSHGHDMSDLPPLLVGRLRHYFLTYKMVGGGAPSVSIDAVDREHAHRVIEASIADYTDTFGE
tara:strand:+ start:159 stop:407 length:249 start_codon:yes stop_codon:yes gene_type:complete